MRVLLLTVLAVLALSHYGSSSHTKQGMLGEALLRRALAAMARKPEIISVKKRSMDEPEETGDDDESSNEESMKHTDAMEDIFVGSGSRFAERGDASGDKRSDVTETTNQAGTTGSDEVESGVGEVSESSGADTQQASEQKQNTQSSQNEVESSSTTDDQQQETDTKTQDTVTETAPQAPVSTVQVADKSKPNEPITITSQKSEPSIQATKKSDIEESSGEATVTNQESNTISASGESDEVTSGQVSDEEQDGGSAEAIRKGMESLSRLLTPVANGADFQIYSGASKTKDEEEDEAEEKAAVVKEEAKGESDKEDEEDEEVEKEKPVVKVKKCEKVCAPPMTYHQCAVPRCEHKMGSIKDLCFWLCEHQKPVCRQECKVVE